MLQLTPDSVDSIRLGIFFLLLGILLLLQWLVPRRTLSQHRLRSQFNNLLMVALGNGLIRLSIPFSLLWLAQSGWSSFGLLHLLNLEYWHKLVIGIVVLDCAIYWQHRLTHRITLLWRLHKVHHSDTAMEVTTALRFHPVELLLSYLFKIALLLAFGVDALTLVVFEIILSSFALFSHSNLYLPAAFERCLRLLLVTPEMHRIHHSQIEQEHNSNYGFCFSVWDRLFASYRAEPQLGQQEVVVGLAGESGNTLLALLMMPFRTKTQTSVSD